MNLILAFIAFNFIVLIHEIGHFIVAKLSGIKVLEFSLFVGPKIFSIKKGDTLYSLRLFPVLAYVKMEGEEEASASEKAFNKKSISTRVAVIAAGPFMNLFAAILILTLVFSISGHTTMNINYLGENSPAMKAGIKTGDQILKYDGKKVYQPIDIMQFLYIGKGSPSEIVIKRGDQTILLKIEPEKIPAQTRYLFGFAVETSKGEGSNVIKEVYEGTPAKEGGLLTGDKILALNGLKITSKQDIDKYMSINGETTVKLTILRNSETLELEIKPYIQEDPEQYDIGIGLTSQDDNFLSAFGYSFTYTWSTVRNVFLSISWLISGKVSLAQIMGPVGIISTIGTIVSQSPTPSLVILNLLNITAFISIALGATNLIPFPALDGSKLVLLGLEAIRKKPLPPEREAFISMIGFGLLIILAIFTLYNDISRLFTGG